VIPFVVLSRLDDVFLLPGLFLGLFCVQMSFRERLTTALWAAAPTGVVLVAYLVHNQCTVGSAMPLSGATKAGFVGHVNAWLGAAVHMGPLLDLRHAATGAPASGVIVFNNSFRLVELLYPAAFGLAACAVVWSYCRARAEAPLLFGLSAYLVLKAGYNTLFVNPWHQSSWYYLLAMQCVTVVASVGLARGWRSVSEFPWVRRSLAAAHTALALLVGSQFYAAVVYHGPGGVEAAFWRRSAEIRSVLSAAGVRGVVNFDDGISAFLLDLPNVHGFGFATDVEAQRSLRAASLLGLAHARGLDCLTGYTYLCSDTVPRTDGEIREFLRASKVTAGLRDDLDRFSFELLHYDPVLRLPFIRFTPRR
jgi:hypothetical protein